MRILVVDRTSELQVSTSNMVLKLPSEELDRLNIRIKLSGYDHNTMDLAKNSDLLILGPGLGVQVTSIARSMIEQHPELNIICFTSETVYSSALIKNAQSAGIKKVLPPFASSVDILQELLSIERDRRVRDQRTLGKLILFVNPKGGAGTTSLVAALGEFCSSRNNRTLLWDLDMESRDLCRSLNIPFCAGSTMNTWVQDPNVISRDSFLKALTNADETVSILPAPTGNAEAMDLICHSDGQQIVSRIVELARYTHDSILVDVGSTMGPAVATLFNLADEIVLLTGECPLSVTATEYYVEKIRSLTGTTDTIRIQIAGSKIPVESIRAELDATLRLSQAAWTLPSIPNCENAYLWPGSGRTLYSLGDQNVKAAIEDTAAELDLLNQKSSMLPKENNKSSKFTIGKLASAKKLFAAA